MLAGMEGGQAAYPAVEGQSQDMALIGGQADIGFRKSKSHTEDDESTAIGSIARAGNQLSVVANGNQPGHADNGAISAIAAKDILLDAKNKIDLGQAGITPIGRCNALKQAYLLVLNMMSGGCKTA